MKQIMRGVWKYKAPIIAEDNRRRIISVMNGQLGIRDIHILEMKKGETNSEGFIKQPLGNHYHSYKEICFCYKGRAKYKLRHEDTKEEAECFLEEGEVMLRDTKVTHTCLCTEDCILIDGGTEAWIGEEWNHYKSKDGDLM